MERAFDDDCYPEPDNELFMNEASPLYLMV